jgi:hypothetical protein
MRALLRRPWDLPGVIRMGLRSQAALRALRALPLTDLSFGEVFGG